MPNNIEIKEMTQDDIEEMIIDHNIRASLVGFTSGKEMETFKVDASLGMIKFGGSFTHYLGHALAHADSNNTAKIIRTFMPLCNEHAKLYQKHLENKNVES